MSNTCGFGKIKDGRFSNICVKGKEVIDSKRNINAKNACIQGLTVKKDVEIKGNINGGTRINGDTVLCGNVMIKKDITIDGNINGDTRIDGDTILCGNVISKGNVNILSKLTTNGLCVNGDTIIAGNLTADMGINIQGNCIIADDEITQVCVTSGLIENTGNTVINGDLTVTGSLLGGGGFTPTHQSVTLVGGGDFIDIVSGAVNYAPIPTMSLSLSDGIYLLSYSLMNGGGNSFLVRLRNITDGIDIPNSLKVAEINNALYSQSYYVVSGGPKTIELQVFNFVTARIYLDNWIGGPVSPEIENFLSAVRIG